MHCACLASSARLPPACRLLVSYMLLSSPCLAPNRDLRKNHGKEEARARDLFYALWIPDLFMQRVEVRATGGDAFAFPPCSRNVPACRKLLLLPHLCRFAQTGMVALHPAPLPATQANAEWSLFCPNEAPGLADCWGEEFEALYNK